MSKFIGTSKEKFFYHNTLLCLLRAMEGKNVAIDLRNDSYVCGTVASVDGFMNISLNTAIYCDNQGAEYSFETLFIQGRNIRYVHIPENIPIITAINNELSHKKTVSLPKEKSRKAKKAHKQHMDTVALLKSSS